MASPFTILNVSGPYREPREAVFSYDYSIQRVTWPTPCGVRVKVAVAEELDYFKAKVLEIQGGSPGQQLRISQILTQRIADHKLQIANEENMLNERLDVMIAPFTGALAHLFSKLEARMNESKAALRQEIHEKVKL
ncbi:MAG: hypothetical protein A3H49_05925 [Nitrospirae bacterium RIFCSPLOWO2_02_FULL_62_14]|nr:MAG: hypothetical protein A3H49_05925 [Nitrospirae bacterium RIFCSPLOWO2_02_FULL_62_14]OGW70787.1 MAG: hypothetical protein A3A88_05430 [Nitrospirae bacterium RIFCSPLOWO2_01_FULL_62_17]